MADDAEHLDPESEEDEFPLDPSFENEFRKLKLLAEFGGDLRVMGDLNPEVESEWLDRLEEFSIQFSKGRQVTIWEYIGRPKVPSVYRVRKNDLELENEKLIKLFEEHQIKLEVKGPKNSRGLYQFITEKLFPTRIRDIRLPGIWISFVYGEQTPGHRTEIESLIKKFIGDIFDGDPHPRIKFDLSKHVYTSGHTQISREMALSRLFIFIESFQDMNLSDLTIKEVKLGVGDSAARVLFNMSWKGFLEKGDSVEHACSHLDQ